MTTVEPPAGPRLILVEGIPGSGKTTSAEWIATTLRARGVAADWYREELAEHPVIDRPLRRTASEPGYTDRCVTRWREFARAVREEHPQRVWVLEGCLLQSTVRFLLEHEHGRSEPARYFDETERAVTPLRPWLVHLVHDDPRIHLRERLVARKGAEIVDRIAAYTETTPCARRNGWTGREGLIEFYTLYARVSRDLVAGSRMPRIELDASQSPWDGVRRQLEAWLDETGLVAPVRAARATS